MKRFLCILVLGVLIQGEALASCLDFLSERGTVTREVEDPFQEKIEVLSGATLGLIQAYEAHLGPRRDPFSTVYNDEMAKDLLEVLLEREVSGKTVPSSYARALEVMTKFRAGKSEFSEKLITEILQDAALLIQTPKADILDLQSNILALHTVLDYLRRFRKGESAVDRNGDPAEEDAKEKESKKEEKEKKKGEEDDDTPPEYPDLPDAYQPHSNDTGGEGEGSQKQHRLGEVNFNTPFFAQRYFSEVVRGASHPFQEVDLPTTFSVSSETKNTGKELLIRTFGKTRVRLFIPPLHRPLQPSDPRAVITRDQKGGYVLELKEELSEVKIPLEREDSLKLSPPIREIYTRPVGFSKEEWPDEIQDEVFKKFKKGTTSQTLAIAQQVSDVISTRYLYSVGAKPETDPIEAMKAGAFQCDMAAFAMVGILRDVYQIPSRVVGGYRAKKFKGGKDGRSYLILPGEAHAWVEVFHDGKWNLFDPTPVNRDKKEEKKEGESNPYADQELENTQKSTDEEEGGEGSEGSDSDSDPNSEANSGSGGEPTDHKKGVEEDTKARLDQVLGKEEKNESGEGEGSGAGQGAEKAEESGKGQGEEVKEKKKEEKKGEEDADGKAEEEEWFDQEDLIQSLELGSLELEPKEERNPLIERVIRILLKRTLDPRKAGQEIQERLSLIASRLRHFPSSLLRDFLSEGEILHQKKHPDLRGWISEVLHLSGKREVNVTYQELHRVLKTLELYSKLLDRDGDVQVPQRLIQALRKAQLELKSLAHPDSRDIGLVDQFTKSLSPLLNRLLEELYGLKSVGINPETKHVAKLLKAGKLNDLRLLSILSPLTDFILNFTPRPEYMEVKTWQKDASKLRGRDLLPLQRFSDLPRVMLGQPGLSLEENLRQGTAYVPGRRRRVEVPAGYGREEAERVTVVLYDTSGSMSGEPGEFQAGLISAFTANALSDVSPSGKHRHRVLIIPFDSAPGTPVRVTNAEEALGVINNYKNNLKNTGGGTDIQKALLQAFALIADAEKRSGEPLAAANIVLMTDGESNIQVDELRQARQTIDRTTPLQTMFIAINGTNDDLNRFANESKSMGMENGFYREFTADRIRKILEESKSLDFVEDESVFYSDKSKEEISREAIRLLEEAEGLALEFLTEIARKDRFSPAKEHLDEFERVRWGDVEKLDRPLGKWIKKTRAFFKNPIFQDQKTLEAIIDDLMRNFEALTRISKNDLSKEEQEHLRHLMREAAGLGGNE